MALRGRRHWLAIDGLGGPSYKFPQFLAASGIHAATNATFPPRSVISGGQRGRGNVACSRQTIFHRDKPGGDAPQNP